MRPTRCGSRRTPETTGRIFMIPLASPYLSEEEAQAVYDVVLSTWLHQGEKVEAFENAFAEYIGTKYAVALFNGTVALHAMLLASGIGPGDEVIVPSLTFVSTATSVLHAGATPVFAEVDPKTYTLDPGDISQRITERTRAIMPVHYGGQSADMEPILDIARRHHLVVLEDAAEAHGAEYRGRKVGTFGKAAMFSFTPTKSITTGEGGMVTTNDDQFAEKLRLLRNHGQDGSYHHVMVGYNYRMTEMQAALGLHQLERLEGILARKRENVAHLSARLEEIKGIHPPYVAPDRTHTYMLYTIQVDQNVLGISRDRLMEELRVRGILSKVYFPPVHLQPIFRGRGCYRGMLPVTEHISSHILSLPCHPKMTIGEADQIVKAIQDIVGSGIHLVR